MKRTVEGYEITLRVDSDTFGWLARYAEPQKDDDVIEWLSTVEVSFDVAVCDECGGRVQDESNEHFPMGHEWTNPRGLTLLLCDDCFESDDPNA